MSLFPKKVECSFKSMPLISERTTNAVDLSSARNTSPRARMIIPHMLALDLLSPARANTFIFVSRGAGLAG